MRLVTYKKSPETANLLSASLQPGKGLSSEPDYAGTLILDLL